jgi:hypothetical protein
VASRIHLLEPQWNPASEEQALDRIHRIGQTQPVETYRYIMKDSMDEVSTPSTPIMNMSLTVYLVVRGLFTNQKAPACAAVFWR